MAGFHVHRGCLAIGARPTAARIPPGARAVVVLEDLTDVDNLGAIARHAAAFGADALLLSPALRRSVLSQGNPRLAGRGLRAADRARRTLAGRPARLRADGLTLVAAVVAPGATPLASLPAPRARSRCCSAPRGRGCPPPPAPPAITR